MSSVDAVEAVLLASENVGDVDVDESLCFSFKN